MYEKDVGGTTAIPLWLPFSILSLNGMLVPRSHSAAVKPIAQMLETWQGLAADGQVWPSYAWACLERQKADICLLSKYLGGDLYKSREENNYLIILQSLIMIPANTFYTSLLMPSIKCLIRDGIITCIAFLPKLPCNSNCMKSEYPS